MPLEIPVTAAGERTININIGLESFMIRSYFVHGQDQHWLLDIMDSQGKPLLCGINLIPGVDNLLKGHGNILCNYQLAVKARPGKEKDPEAPGKDLFLIWYNPGEENPDKPLDPMDTIGTDLW